MITDYEIGPVRPPSEATSLLLRVTRNCPWGKCRYCGIYKDLKFSVRPFEEIKADIDRIMQYRETILGWLPGGEPYDFGRVMERISFLPEEKEQRYLNVMQWMIGGEESVFLQDANTMALSFGKLVKILEYLREKLPGLKRVTSYGRVDSLAKFSADQFIELKKAGLDRIHSGFETGSDRVLSLIGKGHTKAMEIETGHNIKGSGIELSMYYMAGVGGAGLSEENATETADMIGKADPDIVRIRTYIPKPGTVLFDDISAGRMTMCTDIEIVREIRTMIENVVGATGYLFSDSRSDLLEDVRGSFKTETGKMLSVIDEFSALEPAARKRYQIARRMGIVGSISHMETLGNEQRNRVEMYLSDLNTEEEFEAFLQKLLRRFI